MSHEPLPVFISYASYDNNSANVEERWLDRLLQFLKPLELEGKISSWADTELSAGSGWRQEIRLAVEKAKVAILLVSPAFLASEFIRTHEIPGLLKKSMVGSDELDQDADLEEGMLILPILLRPCLINHIGFEVIDGKGEVQYITLNEFQYSPKGSAMNGLSQFEQDKELEEIALRIIEALDPEDMPFKPLTSQTFPNTPSAIESTKELDKLLIDFLAAYKRWWFNALRIYKWGASQAVFKEIGNHSLQSIKDRLNYLADNADNKISRKQGKKSWVYKHG